MSDQEKISKEEVAHIAELSSMTLSQEEIAKMQKHLEAVLSYVQDLSSLQTEQIKPTRQTNNLKNVFQSDNLDRANVQLSQSEALSNSPENSDSYFQVPRVIDSHQNS